MLTPSQVADLKTKQPNLFDLFRVVIDSINRFAVQMGIDPRPANQTDPDAALPPPRAPSSITVTSVSGVALVLLEPGEDVLPTAFYFVERSATATFQQVTTYELGHGLALAVPLPSGTSYWRAYAKYQMSERSPYTVYGTGGTAGGGIGGGVTTTSTPAGAASGALSGTYPAPTIAASQIGQILISLNGSTMVPKMPVTDPLAGWLVDGATGHLLVT